MNPFDRFIQKSRYLGKPILGLPIYLHRSLWPFLILLLFFSPGTSLSVPLALLLAVAIQIITLIFWGRILKDLPEKVIIFPFGPVALYNRIELQPCPIRTASHFLSLVGPGCLVCLLYLIGRLHSFALVIYCYSVYCFLPAYPLVGGVILKDMLQSIGYNYDEAQHNTLQLSRLSIVIFGFIALLNMSVAYLYSALVLWYITHFALIDGIEISQINTISQEWFKERWYFIRQRFLKITKYFFVVLSSLSLNAMGSVPCTMPTYLDIINFRYIQESANQRLYHYGEYKTEAGLLNMPQNPKSIIQSDLSARLLTLESQLAQLTSAMSVHDSEIGINDPRKELLERIGDYQEPNPGYSSIFDNLDVGFIYSVILLIIDGYLLVFIYRNLPLIGDFLHDFIKNRYPRQFIRLLPAPALNPTESVDLLGDAGPGEFINPEPEKSLEILKNELMKNTNSRHSTRSHFLFKPIPKPADLLKQIIRLAKRSKNISQKPKAAISKPWNIGWTSITGPVRSINEDYALAFQLADCQIVLVADGVSGLPFGGLASYLAVQSAAWFIIRTLGAESKRFPDNPASVAEHALQAADKALARVGQSFHIEKGLCTTLIVVIATRKVYGYAYIGDGKGSVLRASGLEENFLIPQRSATDPSNVICACLGPTMLGHPIIGTLPRHSGDLLIVGTDGLFNDSIDFGPSISQDLLKAACRLKGDLQGTVD